jgi:hypothetical protein
MSKHRTDPSHPTIAGEGLARLGRICPPIEPGLDSRTIASHPVGPAGLEQLRKITGECPTNRPIPD